ncbi:DUF2235 domain-containing protein [Burkholderiaceae bacterium FT117]|uniref:RHS repeat-associated core domain-containing protein n=1 Tax=Zeimonas sediminis TaxID=2944268 RepID=UPI00234311D9|nr:RHS repeat-associated core domain-containing protein [Zeimonas sediminis]MCM5571394.1 DUF2235 domain-containing protein [Zeimonas sediminis]
MKAAALRLLACLFCLAVSPAHASSCLPAGGAPGPILAIGDSGLGGIGLVHSPSISPIPGQSSGGLVANLVGAAPAPACGPAASPEPASLPAPSPGRAAGNPVDLVSGNKYALAVDALLPDPESGLGAALREALGDDAAHALGEAWTPFAPLRFAFTRHYNSRFEASGPMGPGWRHGFETALARLRGRHGIELQVVQADGRRLVFRRDAGGGFGGLEPGSGRIDEHLGAGLPWAWRWPDGRILRFDRQGRLARIEAPDRERLALERDAGGRLASVGDASGRAIRFEYSGDRLAALVLPDGLRVRYEYDVHGVLAAVRYPDGRSVRHHYEDLRAFHWLTGVERPDGRRSRYRYDDTGRVVESVPVEGEALGALAFGWRVPSEPGGVGSTTVTEGDRTSTWQWRIDPATGEAGLLAMEGLPCSVCPTLRSSSDSKKISNSGPQRSLTYDTFGLPAEARLSGRARRSDEPLAPIAMHLRWQRHADGPLAGKLAWVERVAPDGRAARTAFRHDSRRQLVAIERPEGLVERIERDRLGRPAVRHGSDRARRVASFDRLWRLVAWRVRDAVTTVEWDERGLPVAIAWPAGDRWSLAWRADAVEIRSDRGWVAGSERASSRSGGPRGAAVALALAAPDPVVVDAAGRRTEIRHDDFGRLVESRSTDAGWRRYRHDAWGRIARIDSADGVVETRRHDAAGRLLEREQAGAGERILTRFEWRGGLLIGIEHPAQQTRIEHDAAGRVTAVVDRVAGAEHRFGFERDGRERIVARELPGGARIEYRNDRQGRPVAMRYREPDGPPVAIVEDVVYRNGRAVAWRFGNGTGFERRDDDAGRPIDWRWKGRRGTPAGTGTRIGHRDSPGHGDALPAWRYRWRHDGLPASIADARVERRLGWDMLGRLIVDERHPVAGAQGLGAGGPGGGGPAGAEYFAWDLAGDLRFARAPDGGGWRAADDPPRDPAGRPMRHGDRELRYGPQGRIVEVRDAGRLVAAYAYNAAGERIGKRVGAVETGFLYRGRRLAAELGADGRPTRHYLRWLGMPVAIVDRTPGGTRIAWLHGDHLGTPHAASDASGRLVWQADYRAFGAVAAQRGPLRQPLRLDGQYHDPETGLHDNYLRSYDPATGRYLEPDPLGLAGGLNRHAYAEGNPLMATDPLGLILFAFDGTNNGADPPGVDDVSNVRKFFELYDAGAKWYMTGVGLDDPGSGIRTNALDPLDANTARARVDYMLGALDGYMDDGRIGQTVDIDVVGFSRGAAMARDFANRVAGLDAERYWWAKGFCVNLRFLGLWDTVAQFGPNGSDNHRWQLGIPSAVGAAFHAVALNEHRSLFPLEGASGAAVIERGFIGSHADVGGGNAEGDLSDVSLAWMAQMAARSGVALKPLPERYLSVESPVLHDRNYDRAGDRRVATRDATGAVVAGGAQRAAPIAGMDWSGSRPFLIVSPRRERDAYGRLSIVGSVDIEAYANWLADHYGIRVAVR